MKLTNISCSCGNTTAFEHSHNLVEGTAGSTMIHVDAPVYHTYEVEPLHDIMEQRAKDKALEDMHMALLFNGNAEIPTSLEVDWSTCFDVQSIEDDWTNDSGYSDVFH